MSNDKQNKLKARMPRGLAERDRIGGDAVLGECRNGEDHRAKRDGCGKAAATRQLHEELPRFGEDPPSRRQEGATRPCGPQHATGVVGTRRPDAVPPGMRLLTKM